MWPAVHRHHDQDQILGAVRNTSIEQIQQICTTKGNRIAELQFDGLAGLLGQLRWEFSIWRSCALLHKDMCNSLRPKYMSSRVPCRVSVESVHDTRIPRSCGEKTERSTIGGTPEYRDLNSLTEALIKSPSHSRKPCLADSSAGVMTPVEKESVKLEESCTESRKSPLRHILALKN